MNTSRLTRNSAPRQVIHDPLVLEASFLVTSIDVYKMHTDSATRKSWCSDSVATEGYGSSQGGHTVYDGMFSEQDNLAG